MEKCHDPVRLPWAPVRIRGSKYQFALCSSSSTSKFPTVLACLADAVCVNQWQCHVHLDVLRMYMIAKNSRVFPYFFYVSFFGLLFIAFAHSVVNWKSSHHSNGKFTRTNNGCTAILEPTAMCHLGYFGQLSSPHLPPSSSSIS